MAKNTLKWKIEKIEKNKLQIKYQSPGKFKKSMSHGKINI